MIYNTTQYNDQHDNYIDKTVHYSDQKLNSKTKNSKRNMMFLDVKMVVMQLYSFHAFMSDFTVTGFVYSLESVSIISASEACA